MATEASGGTVVVQPAAQPGGRMSSVASAPIDRLDPRTVHHFDELEDVPPGPAIIVGNEFLDCMSIRQFIRDGNGWRERQVGLMTGDALRFGFGPPADLPPGLTAAKASFACPISWWPVCC